MNGTPMLSPSVTSRLIAQLTEGAGPDRARAARDRMAALTEREHEVLLAATTHATAPEIAAALHLSEGTVRNYLSSAIRKVGARNRNEALEIATRKGWLPPG